MNLLFLLLLFLNCDNNSAIRYSGDLELNDNNISNSDNISIENSVFSKPKLIAELNSSLNETSGLAIVGSFLITHNDKGNENKLFLIDPETGKNIRSLSITDADNKDWEDLAQNEEYLFIGDIGNNNGNRKDLGIYKVAIHKLLNDSVSSVKSDGFIAFSYPKQKDFTKRKEHNFDSEALIYYKQHLYLFTKNRLDNQTELYRIPSETGTYQAEYLGKFESEGRITGADISTDGKQIVLIGYNKKSDCFLWILNDFNEDNFLSGNKKKVRLGSYKKLGQMESVLFKNKNTLWITSEKTENLNPRLYELSDF